MLIHQYDNVTGAYLNSRLADPDPLNAERWLVPAMSTDRLLPERVRNTWPFFVNGVWELRPDWRGQVLYRKDNGEAAEVLVPGIDPDTAGLATVPRPSDEYVWGKDGWELDGAAVAARERKQAMAEFDQRMEAARRKNFGKGDALAAGLLTVGERGVFKAWAEYQMNLVRVVNHPDFPRVREWPAEPDEALAAEREIDADNADKHRIANKLPTV